MSSINITSAGETTKQNEVIESTMLTKMIHNIGNLFYGPEIEGVYILAYWREEIIKLSHILHITLH